MVVLSPGFFPTVQEVLGSEFSYHGAVMCHSPLFGSSCEVMFV